MPVAITCIMTCSISKVLLPSMDLWNVKLQLLSVAMEMQKWVLFVLLSRDKIFLIPVYTLDVLRYSCKMPDIVV